MSTRVNEAAAAHLERALRRIETRGAAAQLCVRQDGEMVLHRAFGCAPDALFWIFSATKPFVAVLIHRLVEQGRIDLDQLVASFWPAFAQRGKDAITIRHVLQHRTGVVQGMSLRDSFALTNWNASVARAAAGRMSLAPGDGPAYQALTFGFILGEIVQRVEGRRLRDVLAHDLLEPLGMKDSHLGLRADLWPRHVPVKGRGRYGRAAGWIVNRRSIRQSVNPSAGLSTTAADLALFYQMLVDGGVANDRRLLSAASLDAMRLPTSSTEIDLIAKKPIRWGQGFQLGGSRAATGFIAPMGETSSPLTFGHNGSEACIGWADPTRRIAFAYLTDRLATDAEPAAHLAAVADDILAWRDALASSR